MANKSVQLAGSRTNDPMSSGSLDIFNLACSTRQELASASSDTQIAQPEPAHPTQAVLNLSCKTSTSSMKCNWCTASTDGVSRQQQAQRPGSFQMINTEGQQTPPFTVPSKVHSVSSFRNNHQSSSVSSLMFYMRKFQAGKSIIPVFHPDIVQQKENIIAFIARAEKNQKRFHRPRWLSRIFTILYFLVIALIVYFVLVGRPLWNGLGTIIFLFRRNTSIVKLGVLIFVGWAALQAWLPLLLCRFEKEVDNVEKRDASETALIIPAYKAEAALGPTIQAALNIFKPEQIFIIANGNSATPLDNSADVCKKYNVNHAWVPIGSKVTAEFVGVAMASNYKYVLLIDDDVHLPSNFPIAIDRINDVTKCIGYTIKSVGPNSSRGTIIQQCQDMEYKLAGLTRTFAGKYGSALFPHGAIILWDRETLSSLFSHHPGFPISEDWFFGHCVRAAGYHVAFCSQIFVETETPSALFYERSASRGGYGEMTVLRQRFFRWDFFYGFRLWHNFTYFFFSWRLGWREIITKFFVFVDSYNTVLYFLRPWGYGIMLYLNPVLFLLFTAATVLVYVVAFLVFNLYHLRRKNESVRWIILPAYFWMKFVLLWINTAAVYYSLYMYAIFFSKHHPRVIENSKAIESAHNMRLRFMQSPTDTFPLSNSESNRKHVDGEVRSTAILAVAPGSTAKDLGLNETKYVFSKDARFCTSSQAAGPLVRGASPSILPQSKCSLANK